MRRSDWKRFACGVAMAAAWGIGAGLVTRSDYEDALIRDAIQKDPPRTEQMIPPLGCDAVIQQDKQPPLCYYSSTSRGNDYLSAGVLEAQRHLEKTQNLSHIITKPQRNEK